MKHEKTKKMWKQYVEEKCPYCAIALSGKEVYEEQECEGNETFKVDKETGELVRKGVSWKVVSRKEIKSKSFTNKPCDCNEEAIVAKSKDQCIICDSNIFGIRPTDKRRISQMKIYGNFCMRCNAKAVANIKEEQS